MTCVQGRVVPYSPGSARLAAKALYGLCADFKKPRQWNFVRGFQMSAEDKKTRAQGPGIKMEFMRDSGELMVGPVGFAPRDRKTVRVFRAAKKSIEIEKDFSFLAAPI